SGRQDLNLRPPGPQPGALPDCATPRGWQAGDGNRTRPRSLEGFCATTTLRPRAERPSYRRSSTGTSPCSSTSPGGGQGPNHLSRAPSSVPVEPLNTRPSGDASNATNHACSTTVPVRCSGTERDIPARTLAGYLTITSVSKVPTATVLTVRPSRAHRSESSRV